MTSPFAPSSRSAVAPFEVMDVLATVARMRAEGREVISLCAGEPSQGAPGPVHEAAAAIHAEGRALGYTPALGTAALRAAIAGHYRRWYGLDVDPTEVAVTTGSSGAFVLAFLAAFEATSSGPSRRMAGGLERLGFPAELVGYYTEHVEADAVHEQLAVRTICGALLEEEPHLREDVFFGGWASLHLDDRYAERMLAAWA